MTTDPRIPASIPWPPILFVGVLIPVIPFNLFAPTNELIVSVPDDLQRLGTFVAIAVVAWDVWAMAALWRAKTSILPHRSARRLVTQGPFAFSRNPIYLGNTLLLAGPALALDNLWFLLAAVEFAVMVHILAIKPEEAHLAEKFSGEWERYRLRVPRWAFGI